MTTIFYSEPELVIALNKKVICVNPNDLQIFKEVELPDDLTKCGLKVQEDEAPDAEKQKSTKFETPSIQHVLLSPDGQLLAVTTAGQKALLLYKCRPEHAKLVSVRALVRASSALTFGSDSKTLLVTDKTGDCYEYDCSDFEAPPRLLLGHLSIVYDVLWTPDAKFIVTCDRDDKIRVTNYPATHEIHGYCLGHKEFVSALALLCDEVIVSLSGDKTLRVWNFVSGQQLAQAELPAPGIRLALKRDISEDCIKFQAAVLLHQPNECVAIYELSINVEGTWTIEHRHLLSFPAMIVSNLCWAQERLYVAGIVDDHFKLCLADLPDASAAPENWLQMIESQFEKETWKPEDISAWFKKRFDNVTDYLERKKRRIEGQEK